MRVEHIGDATLYLGDCRESMQTMDAGSVQCVVTSPPYWGLRDYGLPPLIWGGAADCAHVWSKENAASKPVTGGHNEWSEDRYMPGSIVSSPEGCFCELCNAWRGSHGLEPTPEMYVAHEVLIFAEVRRVLRDDGTVWLNLGDSYNAYNGNAGPSSGFSAGSAADTQRPHLATGHGLRTAGLKPKDLCGIPWRVAFALQADGWYLRQDIIWSKPNPMPESVTDRCTKAHEYIFLLSKSARYFYDAEAIAEPAIYWDRDPRSGRGNIRYSDGKRDGAPGTGQEAFVTVNQTRNKRSVWAVATAPYSAAHFATFPPKLIEPCVLAGSRPGDTVLDPFGGSGTTAGVALEHGRKAILCELSEEYGELVQARIESITDAYKQPRLFKDEPAPRPEQQELDMAGGHGSS